MADNTTLNPGAAGDAVVTREITHAGDTAKLQGTFIMGISGTEGSYTAGAIGGDATNGIDVDVTRLPALVAGSATIGAVNIAAAQTLATVTTVSTVTNVATIGTSVTPGTAAANLGKAIDSVAGATDTGVAMLCIRDDALTTLTPADGDYVPPRVDSTGSLHVRVSAGGIAGIVDDAAFTPATSEVLPVGMQCDETATDSVDEGDIGCPRITLDRKQIVTPYVHAAAGGASNYTALSTTAVLTEQIKGSAGKMYSLECFNVNAAARYVRLYNQTGAPASTDTANVVWQGIIPGAATGGGFTISWPMGKQFATGIGIRATTGSAHNDTGALAAGELTFNASYA